MGGTVKLRGGPMAFPGEQAAKVDDFSRSFKLRAWACRRMRKRSDLISAPIEASRESEGRSPAAAKRHAMTTQCLLNLRKAPAS